jgi:Glycosyl transferase family 2
VIERVGVVIPARDEEQRIGSCLTAVTAAVAEGGVPAVVCVVADRCRDATAARAAACGAQVVVNAAALRIGEVRNLGARHVLHRLGAAVERVWLLHTDADSVVPPTWVRDHLRHAAAGAQAVAGAVDLDDPHVLPPDALDRYTALVAAGTGPAGHEHAYAANLGVAAAAFEGVGGFPDVLHGEEHALLARLRAAGHRTVAPTGVRVRTSARTRGRAVGGLADLLRHLSQDAVMGQTRPGSAGPDPSPRGAGRRCCPG